jgi:hypothetical protein
MAGEHKLVEHAHAVFGREAAAAGLLPPPRRAHCWTMGYFYDSINYARFAHWSHTLLEKVKIIIKQRLHRSSKKALYSPAPMQIDLLDDYRLLTL